MNSLLSASPISAAAAIDILKTLYVETAPVKNRYPDIEPDQIHLAIKESGVLEQNIESTIPYGKEINIKTKKRCYQASYSESSAIHHKYGDT